MDLLLTNSPPKKWYWFVFPPALYKNDCFLIALPTEFTVILFVFTIWWWERVFQSYFNLHLFNYEWDWMLFVCFIYMHARVCVHIHTYTYMTVHIFFPLFYWGMVEIWEKEMKLDRSFRFVTIIILLSTYTTDLKTFISVFPAV